MMSKQNPIKTEPEKKKQLTKDKKPPPPYEPYKCGLCDFSQKDIDGIKDHCRWIYFYSHRLVAMPLHYELISGMSTTFTTDLSVACVN